MAPFVAGLAGLWPVCDRSFPRFHMSHICPISDFMPAVSGFSGINGGFGGFMAGLQIPARDAPLESQMSQLSHL